MNRTEAIESILEEILNCSAVLRRQFTEKILKNLPHAALYEIYEDFKSCKCRLFDVPHKHNPSAEISLNGDFDCARGFHGAKP